MRPTLALGKPVPTFVHELPSDDSSTWPGHCAASQACTRKVRGRHIECIHEGGPTHASVIGAKDSPIRGCGIDDQSSRRDCDSWDPARHRRFALSLAI